MKAYQKAANAIRWIEGLPSLNQAKKGQRGKLGNEDKGFCCLGGGCNILGIEYKEYHEFNPQLTAYVGLIDDDGEFSNETYYRYNRLSSINDYTNAGFKRIARLMKTKPDWMFIPDVAKLIEAYYKRKGEL